MLKTKNQKTVLPVLFALVLVSFGYSPKVHASDADVQLTLTVSSGCVAQFNGNSGGFFDLPAGSIANIGFYNNNRTYNQSIVITQTGEPNFDQNGAPGWVGGYTTAPVNGVVTVNVTPSCSSTTSVFYIEAASASLSCNLSGSTWNLTGSYSNIASGGGVYLGSTAAATYSSSPSEGTSPINVDVAAQSSSQTYIFYDGTNYGHGGELAQATCPAYSPPSGSSPGPPRSGKPVLPLTTTPSTSPTSTSQTQPASPAASSTTTSTTTPKQTTSKSTAKTEPKTSKKTTTAKTTPVNTADLVSGSVLLIVAALLAAYLLKSSLWVKLKAAKKTDKTKH